jgi:segregation and condensation protein B
MSRPRKPRGTRRSHAPEDVGPAEAPLHSDDDRTPEDVRAPDTAEARVPGDGADSADAPAPEPTEPAPLPDAGDGPDGTDAPAPEPTEPAPLPLTDDAEGPGLEKAPPVSAGAAHLKSVLEALIFVSDKPVSVSELAKSARATASEIRPLLSDLVEEYRGRGVELVEVGSGYQFRTSAATAPFVRDFTAQKPVRLTRAQLETLAIVAYRQPVTRPEIDDIRGVDSGSALGVLLERGLLKILGKKEEAGRPILYGTSPYFLEFFGLPSLRDLPTLREFTELTDESRALFERRAGEPLAPLTDIHVDDAELRAETDAARAEAADEARRAEEAIDRGEDEDAPGDAIDGDAAREGVAPAPGDAETPADGDSGEEPSETEEDGPAGDDDEHEEEDDDEDDDEDEEDDDEDEEDDDEDEEDDDEDDDEDDEEEDEP